MLAAAAKVFSTRGTRMTASRRFLVVAMVAFGLALAVSAPASVELASALDPFPNATQLLANALAMFGAFCVLGVLDHSISGRGPCRSLRHAVALVISVGTMAVLLTAADTEYRHECTGIYGDRPLITTYMGIYLGYMSWSLSRFIWLIARYSTRTADRLMRRGFQITLLSAVTGLGWAVWKVAGLVAVATSHTGPAVQASTSEILAGIAVDIGAAGATYTSWAPAVHSLMRQLRVRVAHRRLSWLWHLLITAVPQVEFTTPRTNLSGAERAEYRLYRRVLEIRDAQLALRPYIPPGVPELTLMIGRHHGLDPVSADVLLEAGELVAALDARHTGCRYTSESERAIPQHGPASPDLLDEAAWLIRVSNAMRNSTLVAGLRSAPHIPKPAT
ncbi:hypothetical protein FNH05_01675 [Amycolatopsis rhizosphaerae]|uniref:DUF6545 domain-containing protein n=1 Tax=Amycolatopsis rhizosphaerae TaxID=2053003 RepID=A0A558DLT4_9PSEU|nr:MAB_1171c family putative transporter [Amycolatopsis rhizosphaerae]TVT61968.1 hypothetical protein FNH05_01675 [Amycolatopsis rhizosphaerae]